MKRFKTIPSVFYRLYSTEDKNVWLPRCQECPGKGADKNQYFNTLENFINEGACWHSVDLHGKSPIHYAAEHGNYMLVEFLLHKYKSQRNDIECFVNIDEPRQHSQDIKTDSEGKTALHYAAKACCEKSEAKKYVKCIKLLMPVCQINLPDHEGYTAVTYAVMHRHKDRLQAMIAYNDAKCINLDISPADGGYTARQAINRYYPEMGQRLKEHPEIDVSDDRTMALQELTKPDGDVDEFERLVAGLSDKNPKFEEPYHATLIEIACSMFGKDRHVEILLRHVNPNTITNHITGKPLIHCAVERGKVQIFNVLLKHKGIDLSITDRYGRNVLHHASKQQLQMNMGINRLQSCIDMIISAQAQDDYVTPTRRKIRPLKAFNTNADPEQKSLIRQTSRILLLKSPDTKNVTQECNIVNVNSCDSDGNTALHLAGRFGHEDTVLTLLKNDANLLAKNKKNEYAVTSIDTDTLKLFLDEQIDSTNNSTEDADFFLEFNYSFLKKNNKQNNNDDGSSSIEALLLLSQKEHLRELLKHPILKSFLFFRWRQVRRYFYLNIVLYSVFVLFLTTHILMIDGKDLSKHRHDTNSNNTLMLQAMIFSQSNFIRNVIMFLLGVLVIREFIQFLLSPKRYLLSIQNYLDCSLICCVFLLMLFDDMNTDIKRHVTALTILMTWMELVLVTGRLPILSSQLEMLKKVTITFLKYMPWYFLVVIAFALSFYSLFRDDNSEDNLFVHPWSGVFKTVLMMTGEFDMSVALFEAIPITSHIVFLLFVFLVAIVMLNLLSGLAVGDTNSIRDKADILSLVYRVKLVVFIEQSLHFFNRLDKKRELPAMVRVYPNDDSKQKMKCQVGPEVMHDALEIVYKKKKSTKNARGWGGMNWGNRRREDSRKALNENTQTLETYGERLENMEAMLKQLLEVNGLTPKVVPKKSSFKKTTLVNN